MPPLTQRHTEAGLARGLMPFSLSFRSYFSFGSRSRHSIPRRCLSFCPHFNARLKLQTSKSEREQEKDKQSFSDIKLICALRSAVLARTELVREPSSRCVYVFLCLLTFMRFGFIVQHSLESKGRADAAADGRKGEAEKTKERTKCL